MSARAVGTTRDAEVKSGDRICEADIYRGWQRGEEDRALGEESFVEVRDRRGCTSRYSLMEQRSRRGG